MMTGTCGKVFEAVRKTSMPSAPGIRRSVITTSTSASRSMASTPLAAWTTSWPSRRSMATRTRRRFCSSSATRIFAVCITGYPTSSGAPVRVRRGEPRLGVLDVLDVGVEPAELFPEHVERALAGAVAVGLRGEHDVADVAAEALQRGEQAIGLDRERAGVVISGAVDEQQRVGDLVGEPERRHLIVDRGGLPVGSLLGLEAERGQGTVVG